MASRRLFSTITARRQVLQEANLHQQRADCLALAMKETPASKFDLEEAVTDLKAHASHVAWRSVAVITGGVFGLLLGLDEYGYLPPPVKTKATHP